MTTPAGTPPPPAGPPRPGDPSAPLAGGAALRPSHHPGENPMKIGLPGAPETTRESGNKQKSGRERRLGSPASAGAAARAPADASANASAETRRQHLCRLGPQRVELSCCAPQTLYGKWFVVET